MTSSPVATKSETLREASRPPFTKVIAAIMPSGADIGLPPRDAAPMMSP
jgi:hypothetical protein